MTLNQVKFWTRNKATLNSRHQTHFEPMIYTKMCLQENMHLQESCQNLERISSEMNMIIQDSEVSMFSRSEDSLIKLKQLIEASDSRSCHCIFLIQNHYPLHYFAKRTAHQYQLFQHVSSFLPILLAPLYYCASNVFMHL